jgi:hypothetical protein
MIVKPDKLERAGWALQNMKTGEILLSDIVDTEREAQQLRQGMNLHQPHRGAHRVIPVTVRIEKVD